MNSYEAKQERRRERLEARAAKLKAEAERRFESGMERLRAIPFGQPMLVDHYSYKRDRNYRAKAVASVDKGIELHKLAGEVARRAASVGLGGISSDDPDAVQKLQAELVEVKQNHANQLRWNKQFRAGGIEAVDAPQSVKAEIAHLMALCPYLRVPFTTTNSAANIRRIEQRIAGLQVNAKRVAKTTEVGGGIQLIENPDINRVQIVFPGKPSAEIRTLLKSRGFRWAPSEEAWQRQLNGSAIYAAQDVVRIISEKGAAQ